MVVLLSLGAACVKPRPAASATSPPVPPTPSPAAPATPEPAPQPTTIAISHPRELRGAWIATVENINWPTTPGAPADTQRQELIALLDACSEAGLNAVFFQIRPEADALYADALEPFSRYLTGTQGRDPGFDPLALAVAEGHARGLEVHAWFNPYRAGADATAPTADDHVSKRLSDHVHRYGKHLWMDPGAPEVREHTVQVVADVVERYDIDGVHLDDYFYPYPTAAPFPDAATFDAHGGGRDRAAWRRANVDEMVRMLGTRVSAIKPWVRFGISPFGIYRPGHPDGIEGFDQYARIYADPPAWKADGLVDYLAPQLYWPTTRTAQAYEPLVGWWSDLPGPGYTFAGNFLAKLGSAEDWTVDEFRRQVALTRASEAAGNIWFHAGPLLSDDQGIRAVFRDELYATPALPPPVYALRDQPVAPPRTTVDGTRVTIAHEGARWWVVYAADGEGWTVDRIVPATTPSVELPEGAWVVTAAGRHGVESPGVLVEIAP